jgi:hypothetical protein
MALVCIRSNDYRLAGSEVDMIGVTQTHTNTHTHTHRQDGDVQSLFSSLVFTKLGY